MQAMLHTVHTFANIYVDICCNHIMIVDCTIREYQFEIVIKIAWLRQVIFAKCKFYECYISRTSLKFMTLSSRNQQKSYSYFVSYHAQS